METFDYNVLRTIEFYLIELYSFLATHAYIGVLVCLIIAAVLWFYYKHRYTLLLSIIGIVFLLMWLATGPFDKLFIIGF